MVVRYADLVYSAASRRVGDTHLAEDLAQAVFLILARRPKTAARSAGRNSSLVPWLLKTTRYAAANALRQQRRRLYHERRAARAQGESAMRPTTSMAAALSGGAIASSDPSQVLAWREIAPLLDDSILALSSTDRAVIVMRFYEARSTAEIASALGLRQDAVRQRLSRAIEKLRRKLESRGASLSAAALAGVLGAHVVKAAPAHLAGACLSAISGGAAASATAAAIAKGATAMSYSFKAAAGILVCAGGVTFGIFSLAGGDGERTTAGAAPPQTGQSSGTAQTAPAQAADRPVTAAEIDAAVLPVSDEVIERTLLTSGGPIRNREDPCNIDLDTGYVYSLSDHVGRDASQSLDATLTNLSGRSPGLRGFALVVQPVVASAWDEKHSPEVLRALWSNTPAYGDGSYLDAIGDLPRTFMFRTDEGTAGVLQIAEVLKEGDGPPRGLRIRYKVLARGEGRTVVEQTAPSKPRPEAEQRRIRVIHELVDLAISYQQRRGDWPADLEALKEFAADQWPAEVPTSILYVRPAPPDASDMRGSLPIFFESNRLIKAEGDEGDAFTVVGWDGGGASVVREAEKLAEFLRRAGVEPPTTRPAQERDDR